MTFENGRKRQDVWSKREWEAPAEDAGAGEPVRLTADQAAALQDEKQLKVLTNSTEDGKIKTNSAETAGSDVHFIGRLDKRIFSCVTSDIVTDEVIITDERIQHIKDRHPNDFERYYRYMQEIIVAPDYIVEANKPNTALILKSFDDGLPFKTVLRLVTSSDDKEFKNSIITFMKINEKEWNRMIKNKNVLYKSE